MQGCVLPKSPRESEAYHSSEEVPYTNPKTLRAGGTLRRPPVFAAEGTAKSPAPQAFQVEPDGLKKAKRPPCDAPPGWRQYVPYAVDCAGDGLGAMPTPVPSYYLSPYAGLLVGLRQREGSPCGASLVPLATRLVKPKTPFLNMGQGVKSPHEGVSFYLGERMTWCGEGGRGWGMLDRTSGRELP
jgi:hypothetical protein